MLHVSLIALHAASGLVALASGSLVLHPLGTRVSRLFQVYLGVLWAMVLFLLVAVGVDWATLDLPGRALFGALALFALYIGWRGWAALHRLRHRKTGWAAAFVEDVGFTLIALFDGFVIIAALDLGAPTWGVVLIGILGVLVGRLGIKRAKERVAERQPRTVH